MPEKMPNDMKLREFVLNKIKKTYSRFGFMSIQTPYIEHIENLSNKQGGENEQLIFKILKRGEKLKEAQTMEEMCDSGLRYDLTVPLVRFYSNHIEELPTPFKSLQIGDVFRADRPQKGRFRQFTQCDIDILGDDSILAEIELITATVEMLNELNLKKLKLLINDRNILRAMALKSNFSEERLGEIFIILDKMDKIGLDGVVQELQALGLPQSDIETYCSLLNCASGDLTSLNSQLDGFIDAKIIENLEKIMQTCQNILGDKAQLQFAPNLVRGMGYYTGTIFEIQVPSLNSSIAGGGRYDKMVGAYSGKSVSACGFSIGFERIITILKEEKLLEVESEEQTAILLAKDLELEKMQEIIMRANELRKQGKNIMLVPRNNNARYQKEKLAEFGVNNFIEIFNDSEVQSVPLCK